MAATTTASMANVRGAMGYNGRAAGGRAGVSGMAKVLLMGMCQIASVSAAPVKQYFGIFKEEKTPKDAEDPSLWIYLSIAMVLVLLGGAFAGLTIA